jgi:hypothetical protein
VEQHTSSIKNRKMGLKNVVEKLPFLNSAESGFQRKGFRKKKFSV